MSEHRFLIDCNGCGIVVELPRVPGEPDYISIKPLEDWWVTSADRRCPNCKDKLGTCCQLYVSRVDARPGVCLVCMRTLVVRDCEWVVWTENDPT